MTPPIQRTLRIKTAGSFGARACVCGARQKISGARNRTLHVDTDEMGNDGGASPKLSKWRRSSTSPHPALTDAIFGSSTLPIYLTNPLLSYDEELVFSFARHELSSAHLDACQFSKRACVALCSHDASQQQ